MENQPIKHNAHLLQHRPSRFRRWRARSTLLRMARLGLPCVALFAASYAFAAPSAVPSAVNVPALQVDRVQGSVQVQRLGRQLSLHAGDRVVARDVVKLGKDARLSLSLANRGAFQLMGAGEISIEQLPPATTPAAKTRVDPIPVPVIVNLEHGDMHVLWHPENRIQSLYVYFARRRVALMPGEYFFRQQHADTQICVAEGQAETMTIAAGRRRVVTVHECESRQGRTTRILARNAATWLSMRQQFAFPNQDADYADGKPATLQMDARAAGASKNPAVPAPAPLATAAANGNDGSGAGWAVNVASYSAADAARQQQQQLQTSGYHAVVVPAEVDGHIWYRVQVSGFSTPAAAHETAVALQTNLGYQKLWVLQHP